MIVALTGPTGVGKTNVAWALIELASPMVFLDCDWFAARHPFSWQDERDVDSVYQARSLLVEYHVNRGARRFVIPLTVEMALAYDRNRHSLERFELPFFRFRLSCRTSVLRERVLKRDRNEQQRALGLQALLSQPAACEGSPKAFLALDTSDLNEQSVAREVWAIVSGKP